MLHYYSAAPERLTGRQIPVAGGLDVTFKEPLGVVGLIVPWNFPMPILSWGLAPALAAGNAVVAKPAEMTPLTAIRIGELALEAGLPEGVFQVLPGKGSVVGQRLVDHPAVRKIVFTGSTEVGQQIMAGCARQVKRLTLELGGKSANIVFADADIEKAAATAPYAVFDNAGQDCCARSRILVQASVLDRFMELLEPAVKGVRVGDPAGDGTEMGPLISAAHREHVASYVPDGRAGRVPRQRAGRARATGTRRRCSRRSAPDDPAYTEEIFGPVVTVDPVRRRGARRSRWPTTPPTGCPARSGPATSGRAIRVARGVETGNLSVNSHSSVRYWTPFGGFKQSGLGRELGPDALDAFTETKNVFIATE